MSVLTEEQITVTLLSGRMVHWGQEAMLAAEVTSPPYCTWAASGARTPSQHPTLSLLGLCPVVGSRLSSLGGGWELSTGLAESR